MAKYSIDNGKVKFASFLAKEAWILKMNISDMYYLYYQNKSNMTPGDKALMLCSIKSMISSHKRMLKELTKTGEFIGDIKSIKYKP